MIWNYKTRFLTIEDIEQKVSFIKRIIETKQEIK